MAHIKIISHHTSCVFSLARTIVHTPIAPEMEQEGEVSPSRIHLPYRDVCKFKHDGSNDGKIPKILSKMLQELGYDKKLKYFRMQVTYEGSELVWHIQVYNFTPKPLRGVFEVEKIHVAIAPRRTFYANIRDAACQAYMVSHSHHRQLLDGIEYEHSPAQRASGSTYIHVELVSDSRNIKFKNQVDLTIVLTKELDSTTKEVEFRQEKYEEAMKIVPNTWKHFPRKK
jgi:hypothetical protein